MVRQKGDFSAADINPDDHIRVMASLPPTDAGVTAAWAASNQVQLVLKRGTAAAVLVTVTPDNASGGTGLWTPASTQVDTVGTIKIKLKVTFEGGGVKHFRDDGSYLVQVVENLQES